MTEVPSSGGLAAAPPAVKTSGSAIASLVCGILAPCTIGATAIPGIILAIVGLRRVRRSEGLMKGAGLAIAGLVLSLLGLLIGLLMVVGLILFGFKLAGRGRAIRHSWSVTLGAPDAGPRTKAAESMVGLTVLGGAAQEFAEEHDGRLPTAAEYPQALEKYIGQRPGERLVVPHGVRFVMNAAVAGARVADLNEPERTVLFFEGRAGGPAVGGRELLRPLSGEDDACVIAFADGHVAWVSREELDDLIWQPTGAGIRTTLHVSADGADWLAAPRPSL